MVRDAEDPKPERDKTDESLRVERRNADQVMVERRDSVEEIADRLVEHAREQADALLDTARDLADRPPATAGPDHQDEAALARTRALEDQGVQAAREAADEALRQARKDQARSLAELLPLEREKTDRHLLSERAHADTALAHRDDFLGMVSHDLRNLLGGIVLNAGLVTKRASDSEEGRGAVVAMKRIERYVARMNRLIGDLVDIVSLDAGKLKVQPELNDAAALLSEAVEAFAVVAAERGVALGVGAAEPGLMAPFDHDRMLQVLANLIANALKFTPRGGEITVFSGRVGSAIHVSVRDTGIGIPDNMLEAVFDRFGQVGEHDQRGLGLGLYIARCIVEAHDGEIWAESELGTGSEFHVQFPAAHP